MRKPIRLKPLPANGISVKNAGAEDHNSRVLRYLELYNFSYVGTADIHQLKTSQLLAQIKKVGASEKHDVAQRLQQRITAIMRYAVQNDYIDSNPASDMAGALSTIKARHYPPVAFLSSLPV